jgi:superfamily II DNA/RNA helicase
MADASRSSFMSQPSTGRPRTSNRTQGTRSGSAGRRGAARTGQSYSTEYWSSASEAAAPRTGAAPHASTPRRSSGGGGRPAGAGRSSNGQVPTSAGRPQRRRSNIPRPGSVSSRPASRVSPLEAALDAATNVPAPAPMTFAELGVPAPVVAALAAAGAHEPFAIQARTLPDALAGRDVLGRAQTGSGKTLAFVVPMVTRLVGEPSSRAAARSPRGLVLVPTRELATQVETALAPLAQSVGLRTVAVYGGAPYGRQVDAFRRGVDIVVATPGRLIDLLERQVADLSRVSVAVLDEADHMADLGFLPAVTRILDQVPTGGQTLLFSATLDRGVDRLVEQYLVDPALHAVTSAISPVESMEHRAFTVNREEKPAVLAAIAGRPGRTLMFVRTKHGSDRLAKQLSMAGTPAAALNGNLSQNARTRALAGFANGSPRVLVATDVAARGIHVDGIDLVVHVDLPADHKDYLHRSGRTARAGHTGTVLALVGPDERRDADNLFRQAGIDPDRTVVTADHPAVLAVASSGTAPVPPAVPAPMPPAESGRRDGGSGRPHRGPRRNGADRHRSGAVLPR